MPRAKRTICSESLFHIYNRCVNKEWFVESPQKVFDTFCLHLNYCTIVFEVEVLSFVLMSNHYHMIARFPQANMPQMMHHFTKEVGRDLRKPTRRLNRTFGNRYCASLIPDQSRLEIVYKYVYANPVKAGLSDRAEIYPYSTLSGKLGLSRLQIRTVEDPILFAGDLSENLDWMNSIPPNKDWQRTAELARRSRFLGLRDRRSGEVLRF